MPTVVTLIGALVLGVLQVLNETVFSASSRWHAYITIAIIFGAGLGLKALAGGAFRAALKLPQWANVVINAALAAVTLAITLDTGMSQAAHAVIALVLTVLAGLGFGPPGDVAVAAPAARHRRATH